MFRKSSGEIGFSFTRFANNTFPSFQPRIPGALSPSQKDSFYLHQLQFALPTALTESSLLASGILVSDSIAKKVFVKLTKCGVLDGTGEVDTTRIGKGFTHELAVVPAVRQKEVVDLLFWWEEESGRLRKLEEERMELVVLVGEAEGTGEMAEGGGEELELLKLLLQRVQMKIQTRPSERREEVERDQDELLVRYRSRHETRVGNGDNGAQETRVGAGRREDEVLPGYHA